MTQWLLDNWLKIIIPLSVFVATYVVGFWVRRLVHEALQRWTQRVRWEGNEFVVQAVRRPFLFWFILLGILIAVEVSILPPLAKSLSIKIIGSLFVLSVTWTVIILARELLKLYLAKIKTPLNVTLATVNVTRITFIIVAALIVLDIWGVPTTPILVFVFIAALAAVLLLQSVTPNLLAGLQLAAAQQIKVGDYIRLAAGEEGYVTDISWNNTQIRAMDGSLLMIPNGQLLQSTVVNYGRPIKKANDPFQFYSRTHLTELTGLKARNLNDLVDTLKRVPDSVTYYHTHHFLEEYHYLTPEPSNDFAVWVNDALGDEVLGEMLASIDTFTFPSLGALRERLVCVIEEHLQTDHYHREAMPGREFYFLKSVSTVFATPYTASDLREFIEALRKISTGSLYFHIFESRLRLERGRNDFSIWLEDSLDETELAQDISRLDPYVYTLEGLRSTIIRLIEKRIK